MSSSDTDWPGLLICVPCREYVKADCDAERTACEHTWDEARDISHLDGEQWAKIRHDVYVRHLEQDDPERREMVVSELASLMYDLVSADALPEDYDDREGLEKLLVTEADSA
ncbi:hypothetical protein [Halostella litorea]|uniref:hypothetical protein n=1 Tax=Halostella litorea TaxID=2528831 RepID=UPI00109192D9|nr:hypothetical protein [Halostella litorea]